MAWEAGLSYNGALAEAVREALEKQPVEWLADALANDKWARIFDGNYNAKHGHAFDRYAAHYRELPHDVLVDLCMDVATRTDTTANGGNPVWIDRDGCSVVELD